MPSLSGRAEEEEVKAQVARALSKGEPLVTLSVTAIATLEQDNVPQARSDALQAAFRSAVMRVTEHLVSEDRTSEMAPVIENKIYKKSKNFIHHFKPLKSEIVGTEYHLPVEITLSLKELKRTLIENKILAFDYTAKAIHLLNVKRFQDVEWVQEVLEKNEQLKRLVETYQKKGELHLKVETSSSLEDLMTQLNQAKTETQNEEGTPAFKMNIYPGVLEIIFL